MKRILLSLVFAMPFFANAMSLQIQRHQLSASEKLGALSLLKSEEGFSVLKDNTARQVHAYDVDPVLRKLTTAQLAKALNTNRIKVSQLSNQDYKLSLQGGLKGGGPISANIAYWVTKTLCYGTAVAAAGTVAVATGGTALGAGLAVAGAAGTAGAGTAIALTGAAIGSSPALAASAVLATAGTVAATGGNLALAAGMVEAASMSVGAFFFLLPLP